MQTDDRFTVGIAGLGLIGGSMAKAFHESGALVLGHDANPAVLAQAMEEGVVQRPLADEDIRGCDLLLVALYPQHAVEYVTRRAGAIGPHCLVVDLCGVKRAVCAPLEALAKEHGFHYLGGHPMAGTEKSGYGASRGDLFRNASMILTPSPDLPAALLARAEGAFLSVGFGRIKRSTPEEHDHIIALTSQLAHVISCAYIGSPTAMGFLGFSAGSFQDMTRVARLNEAMWTELFLDNRDYLADEIDTMAQRLAGYSQALRQGDREALFALLRDSRVRKERVDEQKAKADEVKA